MSKIIMGIQMGQRNETAQEVQALLTKYGCSIKTRLGLHPASPNFCSQKGLVLIEFLYDAEEAADKLEEELSNIYDVVVKRMVF
jgi:Tat protein secretion system quality control protein TatD with DNase activity